jgi:hypothetical protein
MSWFPETCFGELQSLRRPGEASFETHSRTNGPERIVRGIPGYIRGYISGCIRGYRGPATTCRQTIGWSTSASRLRPRTRPSALTPRFDRRGRPPEGATQTASYTTRGKPCRTRDNAHPPGRGTKGGLVSGRNRLLQNGTPAPSGGQKIPRLARGTARARSTRMVDAVDFLDRRMRRRPDGDPMGRPCLSRSR